MKKYCTLFVLSLLMGQGFAQSDCYDRSRAENYIEAGKALVAAGNYVEAMQHYNSARDYCADKAPEVDSLFALMVTKIENEQQDLKNALNQAEEMQRKMELAVFDKAIQEKIPEWEGYDNTYGDYKDKLLAQIDSLDLSNNALVSLPIQLQECPNLKHLNLLGNDDIIWDSLSIIKDLPQLSSIYISVEDLSMIDKTYWQQITGIDFLTETLTSIPENILAQKQLTYLDLSDNQLSSLPESMGNLENLQKLYLGSNQLSSLPESFGNLANLQELGLGGNQLSSLPESFGNLESLQDLNLGYNQLSSLPESFGNLESLQELDLWGNPLADDEEKALKIYKWLQQEIPNCEVRGLSLPNYSRMASDAYRAGKYQEAYQVQQKAVELEPENYNTWFNLSFFAALVGEGEVAVQAAQKTLELNPNAQSVETNLALGYVLSNQWAAAEAIYRKWQGKNFPDSGDFCDEVFLADIAALEAAGISHPDFEKVKEMFGE